MTRVAIRERRNHFPVEFLLLGAVIGFGIGYIVALMLHQAELTRLLSLL
jgi:hypothetical protein